jgi:hypothetical protein
MITQKKGEEDHDVNVNKIGRRRLPPSILYQVLKKIQIANPEK